MSMGSLPLPNNTLSPKAEAFKDKKRFSEAVNKVHGINELNG